MLESNGYDWLCDLRILEVDSPVRLSGTLLGGSCIRQSGRQDWNGFLQGCATVAGRTMSAPLAGSLTADRAATMRAFWLQAACRNRLLAKFCSRDVLQTEAVQRCCSLQRSSACSLGESLRSALCSGSGSRHLQNQLVSHSRNGCAVPITVMYEAEGIKIHAAVLRCCMIT